MKTKGRRQSTNVKRYSPSVFDLPLNHVRGVQSFIKDGVKRDVDKVLGKTSDPLKSLNKYLDEDGPKKDAEEAKAKSRINKVKNEVELSQKRGWRYDRKKQETVSVKTKKPHMHRH